jgi:hypothetical protein
VGAELARDDVGAPDYETGPGSQAALPRPSPSRAARTQPAAPRADDHLVIHAPPPLAPRLESGRRTPRCFWLRPTLAAARSPRQPKTPRQPQHLFVHDRPGPCHRHAPRSRDQNVLGSLTRASAPIETGPAAASPWPCGNQRSRTFPSRARRVRIPSASSREATWKPFGGPWRSRRM